MRRRLTTIVVAMAALAATRVGDAAAADHYLCYKAALAKRQPKLAATSVTLTDRFGGPDVVTVSKVSRVCMPAAVNGSGIGAPTVHQEGFTLKPAKLRSKVPYDALGLFGPARLVLGGPASILDVTPLAVETVPPDAFASDPTGDPSVNRFTCYAAKLAKGVRFVAPPSPTVADVLHLAGQVFALTKITKLCTAVDRDGSTPGAAARDAALVCYAVKLPPKSPKFPKTTVATNDGAVGPHVLVASKPVELCVAAVTGPVPTPTATPTPSVKRVFATSTAQTGGFGGVAGADAICATRASAAGLSGVFKAWVSTTDASPASSFTGAPGPYVLVGGAQVADDWSDLTDGTLDHAIDRDEHGNVVFGDVWTGTSTSGSAVTQRCNDWGTGTAGAIGQCGSTGSATGQWTAASLPSCSLPLRLYCFEQ